MNSTLMRATLTATVLLLTIGCSKTASSPEPLRPVLTGLIGGNAAQESVTYSGEIRSRYETQLSFRIPGKIVARLVDAGAQVKAGELLARLDPTDTALSAAAAQAQLQLAEAELRRYRELRSKNFVSQAALDARETTFKATRAQADLAHNQQAYSELRADKAGVVELVSAEVGQVVGAGQVIMRVARTDTPEVAIAIPESRMSSGRPGKEAVVTLWADEQATYQGKLRELSPMADPVTRTYAARVTILKPDARLLLGMTANVRFTSETRANPATSRLSVPLTAIFQKEGKPALWIVATDQTVSLRPVEIIAYGETSAIIGEGAKAGERIVIAGVHTLSAGEKIKPIEQASPR